MTKYMNENRIECARVSTIFWERRKKKGQYFLCYSNYTLWQWLCHRPPQSPNACTLCWAIVDHVHQYLAHQHTTQPHFWSCLSMSPMRSQTDRSLSEYQGHHICPHNKQINIWIFSYLFIHNKSLFVSDYSIKTNK